MKFLLVIMTILVTSAGAAGIEKLGIERIDKGLAPGEPDLVYFSDGKVGILPSATEKQLSTIDEVEEGSIIEVALDEKHNILSLQKVEGRQGSVFDETFPGDKELTSHYVPSVLPDFEAVNSAFKKMNRRWQRNSQCYNRAHVWNYEEFQRSGLKSKKVFIFYTRKYIRDYNFYWWFHAIPTVLANNAGAVQEWYLDPMFARRPLPRKNWTDIFIRSKRDCPVITKYSTYVNNQESEHCYLHFSSMFYWQPRDLDKFERTGFEKSYFIRSEVNHAYWEAF